MKKAIFRVGVLGLLMLCFASISVSETICVHCWWFSCGGDCYCTTETGETETIGTCAYICKENGQETGRCTLSSFPFHCTINP